MTSPPPADEAAAPAPPGPPPPVRAASPAPLPAGSAIPLPRSLVFMATAWLVVSWAMTVGFHRPLQATSAAYEPGVQLMIGSLVAGLVLGWPLMRLSQPPAIAPVRQTALDLFVLIAMIQVVTWPLRLVTRWTVDRTLAIDLTLLGWLLLAAAILASAIGARRAGPRVLAMAVLTGLCVAGPLIQLLSPPDWIGPPTLGHALGRFSPFTFTHSLGDGGGAPITLRDWQWIGLLHVAAMAAWGAILLGRRRVHAAHTGRTTPSSGPSSRNET